MGKYVQQSCYKTLNLFLIHSSNLIILFRIQIFYGNYQGYFHGGEGGFLHRIRLYNGDRVTKVTGRAGIGPGADIDQLTFHTRK